MHSGPSGSSELSAPSKNDPRPEEPASALLQPRFPAFVTTAPAKKITFFKSGDAKFGGVRMAIHHRSFKCFDALLDDLSQKVPLPFGVRTITTPRGTHSIKRLEQLQDGGCYLCSDRRHTKPINMEVAGKRPTMWHHHSRPHSGRRKPTRPDEAPPSEHAGGGSPHFLRHPKRIVLVKNADPSVRRSIILSRRTGRSLRVFLEEASELMQCHIKKLYTIEGRKIDSIQSLVHSPNVLVCVGREPFRPLMVDCHKNSQEEKLPGMGSRSRSSLCSDGHESKKNVNFGLETKKSIIHPRCDSSNRSTRFSLSSEKSNGVCTPGQSGYVATCTHGKEPFINDDIEKRVLVNKDGSLSVEMKVRFRLTNDETLQWSTEIKKSPLASNDTLNEKEANTHYLKQAKESSEHESSGEVEEVYTTKLKKRHIQVDESRCENCCNHCQEYDIWKNPIHREHHRKARHVKSSSSSASSHKVVHKEASVDSVQSRTISRSSEEYTEHVVEKFHQQTMDGGDTVVEYCTISRCCSRSEVCSTATTSKKKAEGGENRPDTTERRQLCCVEVTKASDTDDRPVSETSTSSKVLESLREDQDDDFDDFAPSASRNSRHSPGECQNEDCGRGKNYSQPPDERLLSPKRRGPSACSVRSLKRLLQNESPTSENQEQNPIPNERPASTESRNSVKSPFRRCEAVSTHSAASDKQVNALLDMPMNGEEGERPHSTMSKSSRTSKKSLRHQKDRSPSPSTATMNGPAVMDEEKEDRPLSAMSGSEAFSVCPHCGACNEDRESASRQSGEPSDIEEENEADEETVTKAHSVVSGGSVKSAVSKKSVRSTKSPKCDHCASSRGATPVSDTSGIEANSGVEETVHNERVESALSNQSNASARSKKSNQSVCSNCRRLSATDSTVQEQESGPVDNGSAEEERVGSSLSNKSRVSRRSGCNASSPVPITNDAEEMDGPEPSKEDPGIDEVVDDKTVDIRAASALSNKSGVSVKSKKSNCSTSKRPNSAASAASRSGRPHCKTSERDKEDKVEETAGCTVEEAEEPVEDKRAASAMSNASVRSRASHRSACSTASRAKSPKSNATKTNQINGEVEVENNITCAEAVEEERAASAMSNKTDTSAKSKAPHKLVLLPSEIAKWKDEEENEMEERPSSALSGKSDVSRKSKASSCHNEISSAPENRPSSAMSRKSAKSVVSNKTDISVKSRVSCKSTSEKAPTALVKSPALINRVKEDEIEKRPLSSLSGRTEVSRSSRKSKPKEPNRSPSPAVKKTGGQELDVASEERPVSAMSKKSTKSTKIQYKKEKDSDTDSANEAESSGLPTSEIKSSKGALDTDAAQAECTDTSAGQEVKQAAEEVNERPKSALSVASQSSKKSRPAPSPKPRSNLSKISKADEEPRAPSAMSGRSKVSSRSKKCQCDHTPPKKPESPESKTESPAENPQPDNTDSVSSPDATDTTMPDPAEADGSATVVTLDTEASSKQDKAESVRSARSSRSSRKTMVEVVIKEKDKSPSASSASSAVDNRSKSPTPKAEDASKEPRPKSSASVRTEKSIKSPTTHIPKSKSTPKLSHYLNIIVTETDTDAKSEKGSVRSVRSVRSSRKAKSVKFDKDPPKETMQGEESTANAVSQKCSSPPQEQSNKCTPPTIRLASTSSDSVLSNARSAADLLRGPSENTRPESRNSHRSLAKGQKENDRLETKSNRSSRSAHKKINLLEMDGQSSLELVQSCLPNASPTDVVHEWLKNIPVDGPVYQMEDETDTEGPQRTDSVERLEDSIQNDSDELEDEQHSKTEENEEENIDPCEEKEDATEETIEAKDDTTAGEGDINNISDDAATQAEEGKIEETKIDGFPKRAHSSVQVMKALLSPKLDRCNSLPEVSPAYGRKLSRSAEGLLDCLAKLRLIDLDPANNPNPKYTEIMTILQTLWLYNPAEWDSKSSRVKDDPSAEDDANPRSSSGVDVSSGSADTPKSMTNNGAENVESSAENKLDEQEAEAENEEVVSNADTPDVAARVQGSQEISEKNNEADTGNEATQSGETHKETTEEPSESPNTSSGKESRSANDSERPEGSSSGTPPSTKQAQLTSRVSLEPDPTWVLSLLKKIEKQFMSHYASAMQEFKVRWNLDDNAMLDTMINELKVEVQNRIQSSIKRELQKIQGRAGKSPRPPSSNLSKDSVVTDQRRRRLKVMRDRSLKVSNSNGSDAASGTSFSDQRSDDEYCPCDACVRKKMEAKQVIRAEVLNTAPVRMEFDLRKILQIKKAPPPPPKVEPPPPAPTQPESVPSEEKQQDSNLDVVEEEPEQEEEEEAQEEADAEAEAEEGEPEEGGEGAEEEAAAEEEEEGGEEEAEETNENLEAEDGEGEQTAGGEDVEAEEEEQAGEDADEGETASVVHDDGGQEEDGGAEDEDAQDEVADEEGDDATDQQQSKDETEDNAIAEKTPMDDTEGDVNQVDSTEAADEIQEELEEAEEEEEDGGEGDTAVQNNNEAEENEEAQDQEEIEDGGEEEEETTVVADSKAPKGKSWEQFRHRQMTRTSVESQTGSMDSMELQLEAKQIVQSVFTNIQGGPKRDWDETGSSSSSKKRSRSPAARANKPRRPKDSDIKVDDDLEY